MLVVFRPFFINVFIFALYFFLNATLLGEAIACYAVLRFLSLAFPSWFS